MIIVIIAIYLKLAKVIVFYKKPTFTINVLHNVQLAAVKMQGRIVLEIQLGFSARCAVFISL